ncbi:MAG: DUF1385 domain-containing protein [Clostridiales bacterium]|nr:DUF1385 domain-containing protein [Clostridiales bacterium]
MADEKRKKKNHKSKIGGQALIEGVMMKGSYKSAMACRLPNGEIDLEVWDEKNGKNAPWYRKIPFVRGIFNFIISLVDGYRCLMKSAEKQMDEDNPQEEMTKFEKWLDDKFGEKIMSVFMVLAVIVSVAVAMFLFMYLPTKTVGLIKPIKDYSILKTFLEGIIKIIIFVLYLGFTSLMKDIKRTYEYHGAEHKTIACHEAGEELNVENVRKQSRFHPRCGTSFIFLVLIVGIFVFSFLSWGSTLVRVGMKLVLMPLIVGISYEIIRLAGRYDNVITRIISAPGLQLQKLTTREPDDKQIEVAIAAIKPCIPEDLEDDLW